MTNSCDRGLWAYPGAVAHADHEEVEILAPRYVLYGIDAGMSTPMAWAVQADRSMTVGTTVTFTVEATAMNCDEPATAPADCPDPNPLSLARTLGEALDPRE